MSMGRTALARNFCWFKSMRISRVALPEILMKAIPSIRCKRRTTCNSANIDTSRCVLDCDKTPITATGSEASLLTRKTKGVLASFGNAACTAAILSRTSCMPRAMLAFKLNSTLVWLRPSKERDVMRFTPAMPLSASSIFLVISSSTDCGDAPG